MVEQNDNPRAKYHNEDEDSATMKFLREEAAKTKRLMMTVSKLLYALSGILVLTPIITKLDRSITWGAFICVLMLAIFCAVASYTIKKNYYAGTNNSGKKNYAILCIKFKMRGEQSLGHSVPVLFFVVSSLTTLAGCTIMLVGDLLMSHYYSEIINSLDIGGFYIRAGIAPAFFPAALMNLFLCRKINRPILGAALFLNTISTIAAMGLIVFNNEALTYTRYFIWGVDLDSEGVERLESLSMDEDGRIRFPLFPLTYLARMRLEPPFILFALFFANCWVQISLFFKTKEEGDADCKRSGLPKALGLLGLVLLALVIVLLVASSGLFENGSYYRQMHSNIHAFQFLTISSATMLASMSMMSLRSENPNNCHAGAMFFFCLFAISSCVGFSVYLGNELGYTDRHNMETHYLNPDHNCAGDTNGDLFCVENSTRSGIR